MRGSGRHRTRGNLKIEVRVINAIRTLIPKVILKLLKITSSLLTFVELLPFSNLSANTLFLAGSFNISLHITSCVAKAFLKLSQQRK